MKNSFHASHANGVQGASHEPAATTPEAKESQMINLAMKAAEQQLRAGTASSQVIVHFLRLGSTKNELEKEKIKYENALLDAKKRDIEYSQTKDEQYKKVIAAIDTYSGRNADDTTIDPMVVPPDEQNKR